MTTPPDGPPNPYGTPEGEPGATPYGAPQTPPANPYGAPQQPVGGPAGAPYGGAPGAPGAPYGGGSFPAGPGGNEPQGKGMAIAALVLAFVACVIPNLISLVLAIIVLVKKKGGKGLAIAAIIINVLVLIGWAALAAGGVWLFNNVVTVDNAEVGQCVSTETTDDEVSMLKQDCAEKHDAEVIVVGKLTADELATYENADPTTLCLERFVADGGDPEGLAGDSVTILTIEIPPSTGDDFVCLIENADGSKLAAK